MTLKTLLRSAALGAGAVILLAGLALAQTPAPQPPATPPATTAAPAAPPAAAAPTMDRREARRKIRRECRDKAHDAKWGERREVMHKCMSEGYAAAGFKTREQRREIGRACRTELKDQRFTEDERRKAMRDCVVKKDPAAARGFACRDEAEAKKLDRGSRAFRSFMRDCNRRG